QKAALHGVQTTFRGLAEVGGQQYQGEHNEQRKHRTSTPDRLVIHESGPSAAFMRKSNRDRRMRAPASSAAAIVVVARAAVRAMNRLELLERPPRADRHAGQRRLSQVRGHLPLVTQ